jgi:adenylosuccinate synthase
VSLRRAAIANSLTGLGLTKLDVLDGIQEIKICTGYLLDGELLESPPLLMERYGECEPVYETMPGWEMSTRGITTYSELPEEARRYLGRLEELIEVPVDMISTGPERKEIVILRNPFDD